MKLKSSHIPSLTNLAVLQGFRLLSSLLPRFFPSQWINLGYWACPICPHPLNYTPPPDQNLKCIKVLVKSNFLFQKEQYTTYIQSLLFNVSRMFEWHSFLHPGIYLSLIPLNGQVNKKDGQRNTNRALLPQNWLLTAKEASVSKKI